MQRLTVALDAAAAHHAFLQRGLAESGRYALAPPKCFYAEERGWVDWALRPFADDDRVLLSSSRLDDVPAHRCLEASPMACADDVA